MNEKSFDAKALEKWKRKHVISVYKNLGLSYDWEASTEQLCEVLTEKKVDLGYDAIVAKIQNQLKLGDISLKIATKLSGKRRKKATTKIYAEGIDVEILGKVIDHVTYLNTAENLKVNLSVCPEHYALVPREEELEVIEKTGNAPFPMQFFIRFNEEEGIQTPRDEEYPYQIVGIAKLKDGTIKFTWRWSGQSGFNEPLTIKIYCKTVKVAWVGMRLRIYPLVCKEEYHARSYYWRYCRFSLRMEQY